MNKKVAPFVENIGEATAACLITMVQGNVFAVTLTHWLIAAETGLFAGAIASGVILVWQTTRPWMIALVLGVATAAVDVFVHPPEFGNAWLEPVITGLGAAALSYGVGIGFKRMRQRFWPAPSVAETASQSES
jgi:hypothetical protein